MSSIVKIGILGIVGVMLAIQFKSSKPEYSIYIGVTISMIIFCFSVRQISVVIAQFMNIKKYLDGAQGYLEVLIKVVGITYICEFASSICKDSGFLAIADQIEILGKLSVMFAGLPILFAVMEQLHGFM